MVAAYLLTHKETYHNIRIIEKHNAIKTKKEVYGYGVRGKCFSLVKKKDSFLTKVYFSFLKLLGFIKTDKQSISTLAKYTIRESKDPTFKTYQKEHGKVTTLARKNLIIQYESLKKNIQNIEEKTKGVTQEKEELRCQVTSHHDKIKSLENTITALKSELASKDATIQKLQSSQEITDSSMTANGLEERISSVEKKLDRYRKGWKSISPNKNIREYLRSTEANKKEIAEKNSSKKSKHHQKPKANTDKIEIK